MHATPAPIEIAPPQATRREWVALGVIALPCLVYAMDLTVLNLALPAISAGTRSRKTSTSSSVVGKASIRQRLRSSSSSRRWSKDFRLGSKMVDDVDPSKVTSAMKNPEMSFSFNDGETIPLSIDDFSFTCPVTDFVVVFTSVVALMSSSMEPRTAGCLFCNFNAAASSLDVDVNSGKWNASWLTSNADIGCSGASV